MMSVPLVYSVETVEIMETTLLLMRKSVPTVSTGTGSKTVYAQKYEKYRAAKMMFRRHRFVSGDGGDRRHKRHICAAAQVA